MKDVKVKCPFCGTESKISIPDEILSQKKFGIFKIEVPSGAACNKHRFIVFIDTQGNVRGYERIDLLMGSADEKHVEKAEEPEQITLSYVLDLIGIDCAINLLHALIFDYPMRLVYEEDSENIAGILKSIGQAILPRKYRDSGNYIEPIKKSDLNLKEHQGTLLIDARKKIIQVPWNSKLKFEEELLKKAQEIFNPIEQVKLIQREVKNFIIRAENANNLLIDDQDISKKEMLKQVAKELRIPRLTKYDLSLIEEFIERRL